MEKAQTVFDEYDISLSQKQMQDFHTYAEILIEWNKKMNLTAPQSIESIYQKHFIDSLMMDRVLTLQAQTMLDVGSGAGFPAVPLKIVHPELNVTIVDSTKKRIRFLEHLSTKMNMRLRLIHNRIEEHENKECFDIVTARAVASLDMLSELCIPYVRKGGYFIAYKGRHYQQEIDKARNALKTLGAKIDDIYHYSLDNTKRVILKIQKISSTPSRYPRKYSHIKKAPL